METEQRIKRAKEVVRGLLGRYGKPHHRIHSEAALDNVNRLRALEGLCGNCQNLELKFGDKDGKEIVTLFCAKKHFPTALYENTPLGESAHCPDYSKIGLK